MKYFFILIAVIVLSLPSSAHATRLFSSGCEVQGSAGNMTDLMEFDRDGSGAAITQIDTGTKRTGSTACEILLTASGWGWFAQQFSAADTTSPVYARFYINIATLPEQDADMAVFGGTADGLAQDGEQMLVLNTDGTLSLVGDDGTTVIQTSASALSTGTWYRIEWGYDSGGDSEVRVDGTQFLLSSSHNGDGVAVFALGLCMAATGGMCGGNEQADFGNVFFDDIAINDTSGSAQTSWPGAGSIVISRPNAAGDNAPSLGTFASIDETTPNDATDFIDLDTTNVIGDFNMQDASTIGIDSYDTVTLVDVGYRAREEASIATQFKARVKSGAGGSVSESTQVDLGDTTWRTNQTGSTPFLNRLVSYTDPTTGVAWTSYGLNSINEMQVGATITDADDVDVTALWAYVEYVDGSAPTVLTRYSLFSEPMNANTNPISATSNSFTPPDNSLLVVTVGTDAEGVDVQDGMSISGGGLTWTRRVGPTGATASGYYHAHEIFTAPVTIGASMQLTISHTGNCGTDCWISAQVVAYTGYNTSSPIGGTASDAALATNGADTITLDATPASDSEVVATRFAVPTGSTDTLATEGAGWTEVFDTRSSDFGASGYGGLQTQVRGGSVSTSVAWVDTNVGNVTLGFSSGLAVEIKAAAAGGSTDKMRTRLNAGRIKVQGGRFKLQSN